MLPPTPVLLQPPTLLEEPGFRALLRLTCLVICQDPRPIDVILRLRPLLPEFNWDTQSCLELSGKEGQGQKPVCSVCPI